MLNGYQFHHTCLISNGIIWFLGVSRVEGVFSDDKHRIARCRVVSSISSFVSGWSTVAAQLFASVSISKSVDFHDAQNRQRPCRMIIRHVKDPYSVCLWRLVTCDDWYPPLCGAALKRDTTFRGMYYFCNVSSSSSSCVSASSSNARELDKQILEVKINPQEKKTLSDASTNKDTLSKEKESENENEEIKLIRNNFAHYVGTPTDADLREQILKLGPYQPEGNFLKDAKGRSFSLSYYSFISKAGQKIERKWMCYSTRLHVAYYQGLVTLIAVPWGLGLNHGEGIDVCKCIESLRHEGTLNSRRAAIPILNLVEGEERWEVPDYPQGVLLQNRGGIEPNRTVIYIVLKTTVNDRSKCSPLPR
ncbi:uncharacterized protein TNCV_4801741 [Trichonephila clavipes]|nr:uncharacterized protein TNCV_4801741 [Trichonephila clavipes]